LGKCGGVVDIIVSILGVFVFPISSFTFIIYTIKKFYFIKTTNAQYHSFVEMNKDNKNNQKLRLTIFD
jgi:hypothetical protein